MKSFLIFLSGCAIAGSFFILTAYTGDSLKTAQKNADADKDPASKMLQIAPPRLPSKLDLAGEEVPLDNFDALERLDREMLAICFAHGTTLSSIKLAARYFPTIEPILKKNGIPDDFKYLAVTESNLRIATSPAGAKGIWQFMPETAKGYGLEVNGEIDERMHLEKVTEAACQYLNKSYKEFNSWTLAAASYNMGGGRLNGHITFQKDRSYYDLFMNNETSRYVPRIIAHKYIMQDPSRYGFALDKADLYPPLPAYKNVTVSGSVASWADFAEQQGVSYRTFRVHNPWIIADKLTNKTKKTYTVQIPQ